MDKRDLIISFFIIFIFTSVVFFSGCVDIPFLGGGEEDKEVVNNTPEFGEFYLEGDEGVITSFYRNRPPYEIHEDTNFQIAVKLENKGEHTVNNIRNSLKVFLSGINPFTYGFDLDKKSPNAEYLEGKRRVGDTIVPGGVKEVVFDSSGYEGRDISTGGKWEQTVKARTCYPYQTNSVAKVCLKQNIYKETVGSAPCRVSGDKYIESSGAPIRVISVKESPIGTNTVAFEVEIENKDRSYAYIGTISKCTDLNEEEKDKIVLSDMSCGDVTLECTSGCSSRAGGTIKLHDGKAIIIIEGDVSSSDVPDTEYEEMLTLRFDYNYYDDVSRTLTVLG